MLTENQKAILKRIATKSHQLVNCTGGFALWDSKIEWSQGRTPMNAITQSDIDNMLNEGYLENVGFGQLQMNFNKIWECTKFDDFTFIPTNEGYRGSPLMG